MANSYEYAKKDGSLGTFDAADEADAIARVGSLADAAPKTGVSKKSLGSPIRSENLQENKGFTTTPMKPAVEAAGLGGATESRSLSFAEDLKAKAEAAKTAKDESLGSYLTAQLNKKGKTSLEDEAYRTGGVDDAEGELKDINQRILEEQHSRRRKLEALEKNPNGMLRGALDAMKVNVERDSISKEADLSIIQLAKQGKFDSAKAIADRSVAAQLEDDQNKIEALRINYEDNKDLFTTAEQRQFEEQQAEREREFDTKKTELTTVKDFALKALELGAPLSTVESMLGAKSINEAISLGGSFLGSGNLGAASPENVAYAAQYAATGTIPTGVKGAQFGTIAALAKELPKAKGTIVDAQTGVKSTVVGAAEQSDFAALQNILENSKKLKELNAKRNQGLVGGSLSAVFGGALDALGRENIEAEYMTTRKAIIDDIARMQTGAALTTEEQDFYNEYLPGRFSQAFFLGENSDSKIDNFIGAMNTRFDTRMASYGLSSYGYTKVQGPNGQSYKVGDKVQNAQGISGTILPDGSVSVPDSEAGALDYGGSVSVAIPKGTLAYANNNPGNLRYAGQPGASEGKGGFAKFDSPQAGAAALARQVALDVSRGNTLASFITKYAPPSENNTAEYITQVASATGIKPNQRLTESHVKSLVKAVAKKESKSSIA